MVPGGGEEGGERKEGEIGGGGDRRITTQEDIQPLCQENISIAYQIIVSNKTQNLNILRIVWKRERGWGGDDAV